MQVQYIVALNQFMAAQVVEIIQVFVHQRFVHLICVYLYFISSTAAHKYLAQLFFSVLCLFLKEMQALYFMFFLPKARFEHIREGRG